MPINPKVLELNISERHPIERVCDCTAGPTMLCGRIPLPLKSKLLDMRKSTNRLIEELRSKQ